MNCVERGKALSREPLALKDERLGEGGTQTFIAHNDNGFLKKKQDLIDDKFLTIWLVPQAGVEPTTSALGVPCSVL